MARSTLPFQGIFCLRNFTSASIAVAVLLISTAVSGAQPNVPAAHLAPSAVRQMQALQAVKVAKDPTQNKIDSRLYLGLLNQRHDARLTLLTSFRFVKPETDGRIPVDIILTSGAGVKPVIQMLESLDDVVRGKSAFFRRVSARVKLTD